MSARPRFGRRAGLGAAALAATTAVISGAGPAGAEPVTPWSIARTVRPDAGAADPGAASPDQSAPSLVTPSLPAGIPGIIPGLPIGSPAGLASGSAPGAGARAGGAAALLPPVRPRPTAGTVEPVPAALNPLVGTHAALTALRERPLFSATRRPPPPPPAPVPAVAAPTLPPAPQPPPDLRLIGVVAGGSVAAGLVRRPGGATLTVRAGDAVEGWTVAEIGPERLLLREGERSQAYRLFEAVPTGAARPAGAGRP